MDEILESFRECIDDLYDTFQELFPEDIDEESIADWLDIER